MATIVLRSVKGSPLSIAEADANFYNMNTELVGKLDSSDFTATAMISLLAGETGVGSGFDSDTLQTYVPDAENTALTIALRNADGGLAAVKFTGNFEGDLVGNVTGTVNGSVTGSAASITGINPLSNGGTGAATVALARSNLGIGTMGVQSSSSVNITGGTISGLSTPLAVADGGTGGNNASTARTNLGVRIGTDVQAYSANLTNLSGQSTNGFFVKTSSGVAARSITIATNGSLTVTNGDGVSGNVSLALAAVPRMDAIFKTGTDGTGDIGQTTNRFGTIYGTATSAQYADLAEKYTTDKEYEAGTVIVVSQDDSGAEGTCSFISAQRVLGVVSTNPAFIMNDDLDGQAIALRGRVPVKVVGPIRKGQALISNQNGCGMYGDHQNSFAIALESNHNAGVKLVECVIL